MNLMELDVLISCVYIYTIYWRKGPVLHGRSAKTVLYKYISGGRGRAGAGGRGKTVLLHYIYIYLEEGTRIARAECEDGAMIYIYVQLYK